MKTLIISLLISLTASAKDIRVLMIDAGVPRYTGWYGTTVGKDITGVQSRYHYHATASYKFIMAGNCTDKSCMKPSCERLKVDWCVFKPADVQTYYKCLGKAIDGRYDIVNMSLSGNSYSVYEHLSILTLAERSIIVASAGNHHQDYREYPAAFATSKTGPIRAISGVDKEGKRAWFSNKDNLTVDFLGISSYYNGKGWVELQGTSISAALYTNKLIKDMCNGQKK